MIRHYVTKHRYQPPEEFVRAVMETDPTMLTNNLEPAADGGFWPHSVVSAPAPLITDLRPHAHGMNKTRIILMLYPLFAVASLWFTTALATEHRPVWRTDAWQFFGIAAVLYGIILWMLLARARRDRVFDRVLATLVLIFSLFPFAGAAFATLFGLWLSWDLRRVRYGDVVA